LPITHAWLRLIQQIQQLLRQRHRLPAGEGDDFSIFNNNDVIAKAQQVRRRCYGVLAASLDVGTLPMAAIWRQCRRDMWAAHY
jgi:hypothetical protein